MFAFQFFSRADKNFVLDEGPWTFDGNILLIKEMTGLEQPSEIVFMLARMWAKAYDVPALRQTSSFAQFSGSRVGTFVGCNEAKLCGVDRPLNFRVAVDVTKTLRRGIRIQVDGKPLWIRFKYVKLLHFCYACSKLGHVYKGCVLFDESFQGLSFSIVIG